MSNYKASYSRTMAIVLHRYALHTHTSKTNKKNRPRWKIIIKKLRKKTKLNKTKLLKLNVCHFNKYKLSMLLY